MNNLYCTYCNSELKNEQKIYNLVFPTIWWQCLNHNIRTCFCIENLKITSILLESLDSKDRIYIHFSKNTIYYYFRGEYIGSSKNNCNITPENFLNKLKTYLAFK
jgi:hypothetical protein